MFLSSSIVYAECDNKTSLELNTISANITANYEMQDVLEDYEGNRVSGVPFELGTQEGSGYAIDTIAIFRISNMSDKVYLTITNDDNLNKKIEYKDTDNGLYSFEVPDMEKIRHYVIKVYSNNDSCIDKELRTINVTTPKFNSYSEVNACIDNNAYYCQKYITQELNIDDDFISNNFEQRREENQVNDNTEDKKSNRFMIVVLSAVIVVLIGAIIFVLIKRKKKVI